ncbi:hypothetical protein F0L68_11020 [Solihabitans fulvus]|uniref:Uncharacterized protein n=1 Tax=Solihabitans fulvus TaxID=1892852 RepID=A0A5B2XIG1_9PSEU|nr:hypothetical protein [Solihabitans fulvus]KAA2262984.1 hypothetical protein F0L68_11020 [Solihabitans fulvus]
MSDGNVRNLPRREWLLRCNDADNGLAICSVLAEAGEVVICGTNDLPMLRLPEGYLAAFHTGLTEAMAVAEQDLRNTRAARTKIANSPPA